jgi:riboflavin transporter FmnP
MSRSSSRPSRVNSRFTVHEQIMRLVMVAMLSALGYLLMLFGKIQPYPFVPYLEIELSDAVVLVAYSLYGFFASFAVAFIKTALCLLTWGPVGSPIPIGNLTALFTSLIYSLMLLILDKGFHIFSHNRWLRYLGYVLIMLAVSGLMTFLNWLFITPIYLDGYGAEWVTIFDIQDRIKEGGDLADTFNAYFGKYQAGYALAIFLVYFPFNLLKGFLVCLMYELLFNRVIFRMLKTGRFKSKIFMKNDDFKTLPPEPQKPASDTAEKPNTDDKQQ